MALLPIFDTEVDPVVVHQAADPAGDTFLNTGAESISLIVPNGTEYTISFANGRDCSFGEHTPFDVVVPVGFTTALTPRFNTFRFNDASGIVSITYAPDAVGVQVAAIRQHVLLTDPE